MRRTDTNILASRRRSRLVRSRTCVQRCSLAARKVRKRRFWTRRSTVVQSIWDHSVGGEPRSFGAWGGPTVRTVSAMAFPSSLPTRPVGSQHPFRLGLSTCPGGPLHPMTGWPSLPPTSSTPWALAGFTASCVSGLTTHGAYRVPPGGNPDAVGSPSAPVEVCPVEEPTPERSLLSTYPFGQSLSAALARSTSRGLQGFTMFPIASFLSPAP
jgi:hypothetical protein